MSSHHAHSSSYSSALSFTSILMMGLRRKSGILKLDSEVLPHLGIAQAEFRNTLSYKQSVALEAIPPFLHSARP